MANLGEWPGLVSLHQDVHNTAALNLGVKTDIELINLRKIFQDPRIRFVSSYIACSLQAVGEPLQLAIAFASLHINNRKITFCYI